MSRGDYNGKVGRPRHFTKACPKCHGAGELFKRPEMQAVQCANCLGSGVVSKNFALSPENNLPK